MRVLFLLTLFLLSGALQHPINTRDASIEEAEDGSTLDDLLPTVSSSEVGVEASKLETVPTRAHPLKENGITAIVFVEDSEPDFVPHLTNCLQHLTKAVSSARPKSHLQVLVVPLVSGTQPTEWHNQLDLSGDVVEMLSKKVDVQLVTPKSVQDRAASYNYGTELNNAFYNYSNGDFSIVISHKTEVTTQWVEGSLSALSVHVGVAAGTIVGQDGTVWWAGIDFAMGNIPVVDQWEQSSTDVNHPIPYFQHQGRHYNDTRVSQTRRVHSVSPAGFVFKSSDLVAARGLDTGFKHSTHTLIELCLQLASEMNVTTEHVPNARATYYGSYFDPASESCREDVLAISAAHGSLAHRIRERYQIHNITLVWNMECGKGQVLGFTMEAIGFVIPLESLLPLRISVSDIDTCVQDMTSIGIPRCVVMTLNRLYHKQSEGSTVLVIHRDPGRYDHFLSRAGPVDYVIGRSMYETDSIPADWSDAIVSTADLLWVPSHFNVETFTKAGVNRSMIEVVPEPVDTITYDITNYGPGRQKPFSLPHARKFNFLSVMKWEKRKGWDSLLEAYTSEFTAEDDVSLYIRSNMTPDNHDEFVEFSRQLTKHDNKGLPAIHFLDSALPQKKMPSLYASADCLVLATHGEGWGLPVVEAMSMGKPVIATNWSGITEYARENNSFLIPVTSLEESTMEGHMWAAINTSLLAHLMRTVVQNQEQARAVGVRAAGDMRRSFDESVVANTVVERLKLIEANITALAAARTLRVGASPRHAGSADVHRGEGVHSPVYNDAYAAATVLPGGKVKIRIVD